MRKKNEAEQRFDRLLHAVATQPEPSEKPAKDNRTSDKASGAAIFELATQTLPFSL